MESNLKMWAFGEKIPLTFLSTQLLRPSLPQTNKLEGAVDDSQ